MLFNLIVTFAILFFLFIFYEETVTVLAPLVPFLGILKVPFHFPSGLFGFIVFPVILLAPLKLKKNEISNGRYPFIGLSLLVIFSYIISNVGENGKHWPSAIITVLSTYIYPIILWKCLRTQKHIKLFISTQVIFLSMVCLYAFYELITNSNPIIKFLISKDMAWVLNADRSRYGFKRLQSFLTYNGALGCTCGLGFVAITYLKIHFKEFMRNNVMVIVLQFASFLCVIFTGTRSVIAGLLVGLLSFLEPKLIKGNFLKIIGLGLCGLIIIVTTGSFKYIAQIVDSFQNTEIENGSSTQMRSGQLDISLHFWSKSPIVGNGTKFIDDIAARYPDELFGAESVWFGLLTDYGIVGCTVFLLSIILPAVSLAKAGMPFLSFLPLSFLVDKTLSSIPGISIGFHLIFVILFLKIRTITSCINEPNISSFKKQ